MRLKDTHEFLTVSGICLSLVIHSFSIWVLNEQWKISKVWVKGQTSFFPLHILNEKGVDETPEESKGFKEKMGYIKKKKIGKEDEGN